MRLIFMISYGCLLIGFHGKGSKLYLRTTIYSICSFRWFFLALIDVCLTGWKIEGQKIQGFEKKSIVVDETGWNIILSHPVHFFS